MLYGLLGSLTYILFRTLAMEIHEVTFFNVRENAIPSDGPSEMLRGVTVSLFFDPTSFVGLAAIAWLAIAFLAGYGVEFLFHRPRRPGPHLHARRARAAEGGGDLTCNSQRGQTVRVASGGRYHPSVAETEEV